jgi:transglutaminase-like putative cysteine protease
MSDGNPAEMFVQGPSQHVQSIDERTAQITVRALRPDRPREVQIAETERPSAEDRQPCPLVQSDDPLVVKLAAAGAGHATEPWEVATKLETFVQEKVDERSLSSVFASAAEVARDGHGDCTEHGVLLAALLRARGIPARVAIGLVYAEGLKGFGYHLWTEAWIQERWVPLDATIGRGGIGGGHLKIAHSNLAGAAAYSVFLPVARVMGKIEVEVVSVEANGTAHERKTAGQSE